MTRYAGYPGGTVFDETAEALRQHDWFQAWRRQEIDLSEYKAHLDEHQNTLVRGTIDQDKVRLTSRWPHDEEHFVDTALENLKRDGHVANTCYDKEGFQAARALVKQRFDHRDHRTYICPEEERIVYALCNNVRPRCILSIGCYLGYWCSWATLAAEEEAKLVMVDPDPEACQIAEQNLRVLGLPNNIVCVCTAAEQYLSTGGQVGDFVLLDAEGAEDDVREDYRGKAIYGPILDALIAQRAESTMLVTHNVLIEHPCYDRYLSKKVLENRGALAPFLEKAEAHFARRTLIASTEGLSVHSGLPWEKTARAKLYTHHMENRAAAPVTLDDAQKNDIARIVQLMRELAEIEGYADEFAVDEKYVSEHGFGANAKFRMLVARTENTIVGLAVYQIIPFTYHCRPALFMKELIVDTHWRGKGVGASLLRAVKDKARELDCAQVQWTVAEWNKGARRLYGKMGAKEAPDWIPCSLAV